MAVEINIRIGDDSKVDFLSGSPPAPGEYAAVSRAEYDQLIAYMGDDIKPFPAARIGGYLSHFMITLELMVEPRKIISIMSPLAAQSVAWGDPFIYRGADAKHVVDLPLPQSSGLPSQIREEDFIEKPDEFFTVGKETIWLQILNLDARMDSEIGPIRIILGETAKREYSDLFRPSLGAAQSLGDNGFPARLFFNPFAIVETPMGAFRAIHGVLSYGRVTGFPPIGTPVTIRNCIPLDTVEEIRTQNLGLSHSEKPLARILALSHPIDMELQLEGDEPYHFVEQAIARSAEPTRS